MVPELKVSQTLLSHRDSREVVPSLSTNIQSNSGRSSDLGSANHCYNSQISGGDSLTREEIETPTFMGPRETMEKRWTALLEKNIPDIDMEDVTSLLADPQAGR